MSTSGEIPFRAFSNRDYVPVNERAIITSYQFQCSGNITRWLTYIDSIIGDQVVGFYGILFEVWRPLDTATSYSRVDSDFFFPNTIGLIDRRVPFRDIAVQPGDVVGYAVFSDPLVNDFVQGIPLERRDDNDGESVWYGTLDSIVSVTVETIGVDGSLNSSTNAAPVFFVEFSGKSEFIL